MVWTCLEKNDLKALEKKLTPDLHHNYLDIWGTLLCQFFPLLILSTL